MTQDIVRIKTGKGSNPRKNTNWEKYRENYDRIFGPKKQKEENVRSETSQPK